MSFNDKVSSILTHSMHNCPVGTDLNALALFIRFALGRYVARFMRQSILGYRSLRSWKHSTKTQFSEPETLDVNGETKAQKQKHLDLSKDHSDQTLQENTNCKLLDAVTSSIT